MKSESIVQQEIMLEAAKHGIRFMRNNRGAGKFVDEITGQESYVRFGLMNESKEIDKKLKSSDLVAIIAPHGRWLVIEVKKEGWKFTGTPREVAQKAWIDYMIERGAIGGFCSSVSDFLKLIGK